MEGQALVERTQTASSVDSNRMSIVSQQQAIRPKGQLGKRESLSKIKHPLSAEGCAQHGDFLPADLLANLTNPSERIQDLGPQGTGRLKRGTVFPKVYPKRPPDNVWNHAKTRERFKHLTEQPPCTCGAGR